MLYVAVLERTRLLRECLTRALAQHDGLEVIAAESSGQDLLARGAGVRVDAAVVNATNPSEARWLVPALLRRWPRLRVVAMLTAPDAAVPRDVRPFLAATIHPTDDLAVLTSALRDDGSRSMVLPLPRPRASSRPGGLPTPREREVLQLVAAGLPTREIAASMGISKKTVENHKQRVFLKLDVQNQATAVAIAVREGWLRVHPAAVAATA